MICCPGCGRLSPQPFMSCLYCQYTLPMIDGFPAWAPELAHQSPGFEADYFEVLASLEASNFWFRARNKLILWALATYFPRARRLLEVGCGTGFVLSGIATAFPHLALVGSEVFTAGLAFAKARVPHASLVQLDARRIPYRDEFDVVCAFDVIEHIDDDEAVLSNLAAAVRPAGGLLISVPQHRWLWSAADDYAHHVRRYTARDLHAKVEAAGFQILRSTSFVSLLLPAMLASRRRKAKTPFDPLAEFRLSAGANRLLERLLDGERALIRAGLNFPLGGSRLIVAEKRSS